MIIKEYLQTLSKLNLNDKQKMFYEHILQNGVEYKIKADKSVVNEYSVINGAQIKQCFRNSLLLALSCNELEYVEGYYVFNDIPLSLEHAWNTADDIVIDTTANLLKGEVSEYFGIKIPKSVLRKYLKTNQILTPLQYYLQKTLKL
jgi:hypothetical protein